MHVGAGWSALASVTHRSMDFVEFMNGYEKICTRKAHIKRGRRPANFGSEEIGKR